MGSSLLQIQIPMWASLPTWYGTHSIQAMDNFQSSSVVCFYPSPPPHHSVPFLCCTSLFKFRTKYKSKSKHNQRIQQRMLTAICCSCSRGESGDHNQYDYGGWDDIGSSNPVNGKNNSVNLWDWLDNWENDRPKSFLVMGFGLVFAWSIMVPSPTTLWWVLRLSGLIIFLVILRDHYSIQDDRFTTAGTSSFQGQSSTGKTVLNEVSIVADEILKYLSLDKSVQTNLVLLMQKDIGFSEFLQRASKARLRKSDRNSQSEKVNFEPQIWRRIFEEENEVLVSAVAGGEAKHINSMCKTETFENTLTSSAAQNQEMAKEEELFKIEKSSSIGVNESNNLPNTLHLSDSRKLEEVRTSTQGDTHETGGNSGDRYGEQDNVAENGSVMDNIDSDYYLQAAVNGIKFAVDSRKPDHWESRKVPNVPSISRNLKEKNFQMFLDEGGALLKEAKKGLRGKVEVGDAESMLYEAADLFSTAAAINPSSLVAVGQWGNTLLVHGELKLKLSQELRSSLQLQDDSFLSEKWERSLPDDLRLAMMDRQTVGETLHEVCEECEKLLVEAGKKYRRALLLDSYDVRSLYNWGIALCFRAQLIAGVGERARKDADKIYLAAIDKFEAMVGISQTYAPDALFSWGLALRNRSHLRPVESKQRTRLLEQAIQLFQDVLKFNPNHAQAKTAAISCIDELKEQEHAISQTRRQAKTRSKVPWNMD